MTPDDLDDLTLTDEQIQASINAAIAAEGYDPVTLEPVICFADDLDHP